MGQDVSYHSLFDFKEISQGNVADGNQDHFELFAQDLLKAKGFYVERSVTRGRDGKKDMIVSEVMKGAVGEKKVFALVSCKHNAHSGKSVNDVIFDNVNSVLQQYDCEVFIGFYSTVVSSGVEEELQRHKDSRASSLKGYHIVDRSVIVEWLVETAETLNVFKRHMPVSYRRYISSDSFSGVYSEVPTAACHYCGVDVFDGFDGNVHTIREVKYQGFSDCVEVNKIRDVYFTCSEHADIRKCDYSQNFQGSCIVHDKSKVLSCVSPLGYIKKLMDDVRLIRSGYYSFDDDSFRKWSNLQRALFYFVSRSVESPSKNLFISRFNNYHLK
ncbi:restriction endonuclease [Chromohalobacter canadensis]|uniref:restriction endonuclease n=1 Tax=Chromohalobacter canadensis TaxID=141389 RepID=UPI0021BFB050|nr:restriction endonuclease [Chromohalobacter canadensis]MCT8467813.1 restriction endonuclease [Chromohalobacter canadensis]MCT8470439.1 restriction endonuclease [Chromohalobacter canadensis]MCT8498310.1 restriction endonuclease [Chromohalobacter canadensis]